jgi:hypothetical protein
VHEVLLRPADLPQRAVRLLPHGLEVLGEHALQAPCVVLVGEARVARRVQAVEHLAVHVELELPGGLVADAHRRRPLVAGEPVELGLGQPPAPGQRVHDLQVGGVAGDRAQQPVAPRAGLAGVPGARERLQREGGVPEPAVAVVPVAGAADLLGQRRRRGRRDAARRRVGEPLEHEQRPPDGVRVLALVGAAGDPAAPEVLRVVEGVLGVDRRRRAGIRPVPGEDERHPLARGHLELGDRALAAPLELDRGVEPQRVRPGDGVPAAVRAAHPRHHPPVVEPDDELARHPHPPADPFDDPHEVGRVPSRRHEVEDPDGALVGLPHRLEHEGVVEVAPGRLTADPGGDPPAAGLRPAEQRGEARRRVEARQTQPVDRAVAADEGGGLQVADDRVVLDPRRRRAGPELGRVVVHAALLPT